MTNMEIYEELVAFHPGYYIAEVIADLNMSQADFAARIGTTPKNLSELISGKTSLSVALAENIGRMLGTGADTWINLQNNYDKKKLEISNRKDFDEQAEIAKGIDYNFFIEIAGLQKARAIKEKIENLCTYLKISTLKVLAKHDFLVSYRSTSNASSNMQMINAKAWLQTAMNFANETEAKPYDPKLLARKIPAIRAMTCESPDKILRNLSRELAECGVVFVFLPYLKNSYINGAVKWLYNGTPMIAMNNMRSYADIFWFSLFHEIKHVMQKKTKSVFMGYSREEMQNVNDSLEKEADEFARNTLIPLHEYSAFVSNGDYSKAAVLRFAEKIGIATGIVAGRLENDKKVRYGVLSCLKEKYEIKRKSN